ncbi:MAG TPA: alpha/beta hydrolase [Phycisphaerales bacterium]|nr:alpha/beta hydrolase [Phycisphaerales bacterium]
MNTRAIVAMAAILPLATAWCASAQTFQRFADIPYGDGDPAQRLDVYVPIPVPQRLRPVILWIHGGGWQSGDKLLNTGRVNAMLARGFIVASTNYRLTGTAPSPAQIHDCKAAVRFLRANAAQYRIDPSRIGVWGSSAGGHLVAHLGTSGGVAGAEGTVGPFDGVSSRVQAVADYFGPTDFFNVDGWHEQPGTPEAALLGFSLGDLHDNVNNPAWAAQVALAHLTGVVEHVTPDDPPFYIAHGTADNTVWPEHSELLFAALQQAGVPSSYRPVPGAGHGLPGAEDVATLDFLVQTLGRCPIDSNGDGVIEVPPCDCVDVNNDGLFPDTADVDAFLAVFSGGPCPTGPGNCGDIDFNNDALFPDTTDIDALLSVFSGGPCL